MSNPKRGEIWWVSLDEGVERQVLIVSPYEMPKAVNLIITLVIAKDKPEGFPLWVSLGNDRWVRCELIHSMRMDRAISFVERVSLETMVAVREMLCNLLPLEEGEERS